MARGSFLSRSAIGAPTGDENLSRNPGLPVHYAAQYPSLIQLLNDGGAKVFGVDSILEPNLEPDCGVGKTRVTLQIYALPTRGAQGMDPLRRRRQHPAEREDGRGRSGHGCESHHSGGDQDQGLERWARTSCRCIQGVCRTGHWTRDRDWVRGRQPAMVPRSRRRRRRADAGSFSGFLGFAHGGFRPGRAGDRLGLRMVLVGAVGGREEVGTRSRCGVCC